MRFPPLRLTARRLARYALRKSSVWVCTLLLIAGAILAPVMLNFRFVSADDARPQDLLQFLELTIRWDQVIASQQATSADPGDLARVNQDRKIADRVVQVAFEYARAASQSTTPSAGPSAADNGSFDTSDEAQRLEALSAELNQDVQGLQGEVASLRLRLESATGKKLQDLQGLLAETQSELELAQARRDAVRNMTEFLSTANSSGSGTSALRAQVELLARSVPAAQARPASRNGQTAPPDASFGEAPVIETQRLEPNGIWALAADIVSLYRERSNLAGALQLTNELDQSCANLRAPYLNAVKQMTDQGDAIAREADTAGPSAYAQQKKELDSLTAQFKASASQSLPLNEMDLLLSLCQKNLADWYGDVRGQLSAETRSLLFRVGGLAAVLVFVFVIAEIWRRLIFRYVHDAHRQYILLLARKIALAVAIASVVLFTFAGELSSIATFAGLLTAGVAVALQNVILSVAGYFFLIGKYGIRAGDRVEIAGVTGEVVDVGLVRLHLMELGKGGLPDPSGRVVAFPNSVVFQSNAGLFRQIPGTNFSWREITLTFAPDNDLSMVKEVLAKAVEAAFSAYREEIEQQNNMMRKMASVTSLATLSPRIRWSVGASAMEAHIRFPIARQESADVDSHFTQQVLDSLKSEPRIKLAGSPVTPKSPA